MNCTIIHLPDLAAGWKWPRSLNPHFDDIDQECIRWAADFGAFTPRMQRAIDKCRFNLLAGLSYPYMCKDELRSACDLMNLFFIFDEHSDQAGPEEVKEQGRILMDAFHNVDKSRPAGEWIGGEIARQFWMRICSISNQMFQKRFLERWQQYVDGVVLQAELRSQSLILDLDNYFPLRRATVGTLPSFTLSEMNLDIPDEIREHHIILELEMIVTDMVAIVNDVLSYNKEQASGDIDHNLITVIMNENHCSLQHAMDQAGDIHNRMTERFHQLYQQIPRWGGPIDLKVQRLIDGIAWWQSGNLYWSYESGRYFGKRGLEIQQTHRLPLLRKVRLDGQIGPLEVDSVGQVQALQQRM